MSGVHKAEPRGDPDGGWERICSLLDAITTRLYTVDRSMRLTHADGPLDPFTGVDTGHTAPHSPLGDSLLDLLPEPERTRWDRIARGALDDTAAEPVGFVVTRMIAAADHTRVRLAHVTARRFAVADGQEGVVFICKEIPEWLAHTGGIQSSSSDDVDRLDLARQFAATLNHEINNPLFVVSATLEDLLAEEHDPAAAKRLRLALDSVWRVAEAVKQFQEMRRIVSTSYIPGYTMIDLNESSQRG